MNRGDFLSIFYRLILRMHPRPFLDRFGDEMLWIFEEERRMGSGTRLAIDGVLSLLRQHAKTKQGSKPILAGFVLIDDGLGISPLRFIEAGFSASILLAGFVLLLGKVGPPLTVPHDPPQIPLTSQTILATTGAKTPQRTTSSVDRQLNSEQDYSAVGSVAELGTSSAMASMAEIHPFEDNSLRATGPGDQEHGFDPTGIWQATLSGQRDLRLVLKISRADDGKLKALLYSIDRSGQALPVTAISHEGATLKFALGSINATFEGRASKDGNSVAGRWTQNATTTSLNFQRANEQTAWTIPPPPPRLEANSKEGGGSYEVATVRPSDPGTQGSGFRVSGRQLEAINTSLRELIEFGYELQEKQILNVPEWMAKDKFDIVMLYEGKAYPNDSQCKSMVRQVLSERFGFKFHRDNKELPVYALVLARTGPKLTKSEGDPNGLPGLYLSAPGTMSVRNATMADFVGALQRTVLNRPVTDQTGLTGRWDFGLNWIPDETQRPSDPPPNSDKPDLQTAIQEQLGLKLDATKAIASVLVIDHVEKPSEN